MDWGCAKNQTLPGSIPGRGKSKRYFEYQSLEKIAVSMNYTYRWIRRLHGRALQDFEKVMGKEGMMENG